MSLADEDRTVVPASLQSASNVNRSKDLIRCLPLHLSLYILGFLDQKSLDACTAVSRCWAFRAREVRREHVCQSTVQEKILYLQLNEEGDVIEVKGHDLGSKTKEEEGSLQAAYHDLQTDTIQLEERNVFCGSYNIRALSDQSDSSRTIHYCGGDLVAVGSADRKVRLLDMSGMKEASPLLSGHAGSIKALFLHEKKGFVLSASFDLSIRCWNIYSGACVKIFNGHCGTITCLDLHEEQFVSGARDGVVKVWDLETGKCLQTLRHNGAVRVVKMDGTRIVTGCDRGLVKVWCADTGTLIKTLEGHQGAVTCLSFDQWHLVTGSTDGYALGWSMLGNFKRCLTAFRHSKEVLSLEFLYLRVISGCADGKIRIFNYLTGSCLRVLMANRRGDPISSFYVAENRMVVNSPSSLLLFQFESVRWDYTLDADRERVGKQNQRDKASSRKRLHLQRAARHDVGQAPPLAPETQDADQLMLSCWIRRQSLKGRGTDSLTMKRISVPFERKMLQLKMKNSLHGPTVPSSIPAPSVVRPKTCRGLLQEKQAHGGHGKANPPTEDGVQLIDPFTASSELIRSTRTMIAQTKNEAVSRRKKLFCPYAADPSCSDSGFRLLTGKQKEAYEAAVVAQHQAHQAQSMEDQQRARKKAWLRKIKGLPVDSFTGEGKIAAPELGLKEFI
ncbi:PREDICTED: F-box/WD repeat-containing protein 10-like [Eurypyga helias]|uniref:F-box/WD repeat-containing protein 10-like n=1 Tax=Eurypyga helias TaxID=54383 RepID=UPI000528DD04|nr:PREDICTED: F-box/WD repeat-containing protein 10-like [Eurypyga helias]